MKLSTALLQDRIPKPEDFNRIPIQNLFFDLGLGSYLDAGFIFYSPFGKKIYKAIDNLLIDTLDSYGFYEVQLPLIHDKDLVIKSGAFLEFKDQFFEINKRYVLIGTSEEYLLEQIKKNNLSYRQLPLRYFFLVECFRNILRNENILKTKEFGGVCMLSINKNEEEFQNSLNLFIEITDSFLRKLKIPFIKVPKNEGIEYIWPKSDGEKFYDGEKEIVGISLAMGYKYLKKFDLKFMTKKGVLEPPVVGTYGIGTQRCLVAALDSNRSSYGFKLPEEIKPFTKAIIPVDFKDDMQMGFAEKIYLCLKKYDTKIYFDDRNRTLKEKLDFADFWSVDEKYIVGRREIKNGKVLVKTNSGENYINLEEIVKNG